MSAQAYTQTPLTVGTTHIFRADFEGETVRFDLPDLASETPITRKEKDST